MRAFLYILCQCTWGILQTLLGAFVFLANAGGPHHFYHGAVVTEWKSRSGLSLGLFVFVGEGATGPSDRMLIHEYGHTIQSLILGPLFLFAVGLPSVLWAGLPCCDKMRRKRRISYYSFYTEKWADHLGERATAAGGCP